jgi:hypothetical protein
MSQRRSLCTAGRDRQSRLPIVPISISRIAPLNSASVTVLPFCGCVTCTLRVNTICENACEVK